VGPRASPRYGSKEKHFIYNFNMKRCAWLFVNDFNNLKNMFCKYQYNKRSHGNGMPMHTHNYEKEVMPYFYLQLLATNIWLNRYEY
jgi:hypothetical protein